MRKEQVSKVAESEIISNKKKDDDTIIIADIFRQHIVKIEINSESVNFSRKVDLYTSDEKEKWN